MAFWVAGQYSPRTGREETCTVSGHVGPLPLSNITERGGSLRFADRMSPFNSFAPSLTIRTGGRG